MREQVASLGRRISPSGLVVAGLGFFLTRFTVALAVIDEPTQFVLVGVVPLVLGLGLSAFGVSLAVGKFEATFVRTVTLWCLAGTGAMLVLVVLTLVGNDGMATFTAVRTRTYLSNFLIGGSVGGALTGVYAARANRHQRELEQQAARLDMVNRLLRDRVLNALTVIRGRVEVARLRDDAPVAGTLGIIDDHSAGVQTTIENMKHVTRGGTRSASLDPVAVVPCVEAGVEAVRKQYPHAEYTLDTDVPEDLTVRANTMLERLVTHLVENAVVYNDAERPRVSISVTADGNAVCIRVADDGPGLPDEQVDLLRNGEIGTYEDRSTGFGLDLVRLIVRSYGGTTDATVTDDGSTVTLSLPRVAADGEVLVEPDPVYGVPSRDIGVAVVGAIVAAVVMGVPYEVLTGTVPVIGALYGVRDLWIGWITHAFHSVVFGLVYAALVQHVPERFGDRFRYFGVALTWALALWLVAAGIVMPVWLTLVGIEASLPNLTRVTLLGHLLWGGSLAVCYRYGRRFADALQ